MMSSWNVGSLFLRNSPLSLLMQRTCCSALKKVFTDRNVCPPCIKANCSCKDFLSTCRNVTYVRRTPRVFSYYFFSYFWFSGFQVMTPLSCFNISLYVFLFWILWPFINGLSQRPSKTTIPGGSHRKEQRRWHWGYWRTSRIQFLVWIHPTNAVETPCWRERARNRWNSTVALIHFPKPYHSCCCPQNTDHPKNTLLKWRLS